LAQTTVKSATAIKIEQSKHESFAQMGCVDCHPTEIYKACDTNNCLSCHDGFEDLARATQNLDPNPHDSPHYGQEFDCDLCHHEHEKSENFCSQCHEWELKIP
jgi:Cytochrome c3